MKKIFLSIALVPFIFIYGYPSPSQELYGEATEDTLCQEAVDRIDLNVDLSQLVASFRLPSKGMYGVKFAWTSDNEAVEVSEDSIDGYPLAKVSQDKSEAENGNLNVTAYLIDHTSANKTFPCTVLQDTGSTTSKLPTHWEEDFSSYESGIELANYDRWQCSSLEGGEAMIENELETNINEMPSSQVLACHSVRTSSILTYKREANVTATDNQNGAVIEGEMLYTGETNGVAIEAINSAGKTISGFQFSSSDYALNKNGSYLQGKTLFPTEGVWEHFRLFYYPNVGRSFLSIYDWLTSSWIDVMVGTEGYDSINGISGEGVGSVVALRIALAKGSLYGTTYIANLKMDNVSSFPLTSPTNPNRSIGFGTISGYEETIFAFEGETISGTNPSFVVRNRFAPDVTLLENTDYTLTSSLETQEDSSTLYTYLFVLKTTGETKNVTQSVYVSSKDQAPSVNDFRGSYLKKDSETTGHITITGKIIRGDITFHYALLKKGASTPTKEQILGGTSEECVDYGAKKLTSHEFSFDTNSVDLTNEYDLYGYATTETGESGIYLSKDLSTIVNIETPEDFHTMSSDLSTLGSTFRLLNDIDFSSYYWAFDSASRSFAGVLEGNGHTIKNLTISNSSDDKSIKSGLFFNFNGTIENLRFENCVVEGFADVGLLGGNAYGCTVRNCSFFDCESILEPSLSGGDGYFGLLVGRCRGKDNLFENIEVQNAIIKGNQRCGLLVGGTEAATYDVNVIFNNIVVDGSISEAGGAQAGLMGRNYSKSKTSTLTVTNAFIKLSVLDAKKEVGTVLGRNETGSKVAAKNVYGDLTIKALDQSGYFGQFIGYDVSASGNYTTFNFQGTDLYFLDNDYSALGDNIVYNLNAVNGGTTIGESTNKTQRWWETSTWIKDFDTSLVFSYDETLAMPIVDVKDQLSLKASDFEKWVDALEENDLPSCHYALYKAGDVLAELSLQEKALIDEDKMTKYENIKKAYEELIASLGETDFF